MPALIIVDQQDGYRRDLGDAIAALLPDLQVHGVGVLDDLSTLLLHCDPVDLVLVDFRQSVSATVSRLVRLRMVHPRLRFAVMADRVGRREMMDSSAAGLAGIVSKARPLPDVAASVVAMLQAQVAAPAPSREGRGRSVSPPPALDRPRDLVVQGAVDPARLTQRQREVLGLLALGLSNKEIARRLNIAEPTAKIHVAALMRVLGARNRVEVAALARAGSESVG